MNKDEIAARLRREAAELASRGENLYRIRAFRQAAFAILAIPTETNGWNRDDWERVPGIGKSLAKSLESYANSGVWPEKKQEKNSRSSEKSLHEITRSVMQSSAGDGIP